MIVNNSAKRHTRQHVKVAHQQKQSACSRVHCTRGPSGEQLLNESLGALTVFPGSSDPAKEALRLSSGASAALQEAFREPESPVKYSVGPLSKLNDVEKL